MPERIQGNTGTVRQLEDWASFLPQTTRALAFVRRAFAEPHDMSRSIEMSNNANIDGQLSFPRLATLAREWDSLGATTPAEFVDALSAEVVGHPKYEAVCSALRDVSLLPVRFPQEQEPEDAEWMWK